MTTHFTARLMLLLPLLCACAPKPVPVPPELGDVVHWLRDHPTTGGVLTLTATGAAAVAQAGLQPFHEPAGQAALLAHDVTPLQHVLIQQHLDYVLTTEPDYRDAPDLPKDKAVLVPSVLQHLVALYGTGTRDRACVDRLQLVATSGTVRTVGGRHLPAALLFKRVQGAQLQLHKLVPGIPVRVATHRRVAGQVFTFDCQTRADANGDATVRFPYPTVGKGANDPDAQQVLMWTALTKVGEAIQVSNEAVDKGLVVDLSQ